MDAFPENWVRMHLIPYNALDDPTINHVWANWGRPNVSGEVIQVIWRSYTVEDAKSYFQVLSLIFLDGFPQARQTRA